MKRLSACERAARRIEKRGEYWVALMKRFKRVDPDCVVEALRYQKAMKLAAAICREEANRGD